MCILWLSEVGSHAVPLHILLTSLALRCICIGLHCFALHCIALHCIALDYIALHCIALQWMQCPTIALGVALHCPPVAVIIGIAGCTELQQLLAQL